MNRKNTIVDRLRHMSKWVRKDFGGADRATTITKRLQNSSVNPNDGISAYLLGAEETRKTILKHIQREVDAMRELVGE